MPLLEDAPKSMPKLKKQTKSKYKLSFDRSCYSNYASVSQILGENMKVAAKVTFDNGTFDEWAEFFESYRLDREEFITNETKKVSSLEARVEFEIKDLEGLTDLSSRKDIITREKELGVKTEIIWYFNYLVQLLLRYLTRC